MPRIEVENFGPIAEAEVEMKPLTVFMGPNSSGKSYLALLIYSLARLLGEESEMILPGRYERRSSSRLKLSEKLVDRAVHAFREAWPNPEDVPEAPPNTRELPKPVRDLFQETFQLMGKDLASVLAAELRRCFGTQILGLSRQGLSVQQTGFRVKFTDSSGSIWDLLAQEDELVTSNLDQKSPISDYFKRARYAPWQLLVDDPARFLPFVLRHMPNSILAGLSTEAYYMPASRSGILLGHKTLASLIVGRSSLAWVEPMEIPRLPGVVTDLIQALLVLSPSEPTPESIHGAVDFLQGKILKGTVDLDPRGEYPEIFYEHDAGRFKLHQVSSMVSEIAPIVLYLKYLVEPGHLFVIEEPESHIDSHNQRNLAIAIAMLVNAGVKVLVTTHSEYFISQLSNLIMASQLSIKKRSAHGYGAKEVLDPQKVGAYLFQPTEDGTKVNQVRVTSTDGIPLKQFAEVHRQLYDEAIALEHS